MRTGAMLFPVDPSADSHDLSKRSMKTCPVCDTPYPDQHNTCPTDGALLLETRELEPGQTVRGKYRIVRKLGQGGMGTVYLAEHQMLGGQVALKFLSSALSRDPQFVKRFRNEARAAYLLRHSNIVEVTDLDQDEDGSLFLAMEYVPGPSLRHAMKELKGPIATARAVEIVRGVAAGLAAAHARATVHRDIKPENILLHVGTDGAVQPKVLDFGIAALTDNLTGYSQTHGLLLTPEYAAPEQWRGTAASELDGRTDLYALGGVMYEMLAGHKAFHAVNAEGWMYQHLQGVPTPLVQCRPDIEREWPGLAAITMRLLEKERERRFSSAEALLRALDQRPKTAAQPAAQPPQPALPVRIEPPPSTVLPLQSTVQPISQAPAPALAPGPRFITAADSSDDRPQSPRSSWIWTVLAASVAVVLGLILIYRQVRPATAAPEITTAEGAASGLRTVVLSDATPGAKIHYTVDGSEPTEGSLLYRAPVTLMSDGAVKVRARAFVSGHKNSPIVQVVVPETHAAKRSAPRSTEVSVYDQAMSAFKAKQYAEARRLFDESCTGGEPRACDYLGYLYSEGLGGPADTEKAGKIYADACAHGQARSCTALGVLYTNAGDSANARTYVEKGCSLGDNAACMLMKSKIE